jgi:3-phenylpropionate/cinnamic acid dioxygenase small subunit
MTDQEAKDRLEIQELLARYSWALTDKDWDAWQGVFAPGATVDYGTAGGPVGSPADAAAGLSAMMAAFDVALSQSSNFVLSFETDDLATGRSMYRMLMRIPGDPPTYMEAQGSYDDRFIRTSAGWRIQSRFENLVYVRA